VLFQSGRHKNDKILAQKWTEGDLVIGKLCHLYVGLGLASMGSGFVMITI